MSIGCRAQHESVFWASKNYGSLIMERLLSDDLKEFLRFLKPLTQMLQGLGRD
jgi:hypothetical protein